MNPLFSIITVSYNAAGTIGRTLDSVASQTCGLYEHIVVDGASTDGTRALVAAAAGADRRCLISEPDRGLYDAMNKGMALATGDYLIFLNSGDKFHSTDTLQLIADTIMREDYPGVVYGQTDLVDDSGRRIGPRHLTAPERLGYADFARGMLVCHQAFVVLARIAPRYSMQYRFSADYDWTVKCIRNSNPERCTNLGIIAIDYLSDGLTDKNKLKSLRERYRIMSTHYGSARTLLNHLGFLFRALRRRL